MTTAAAVLFFASSFVTSAALVSLSSYAARRLADFLSERF